MRLDLWFAFVVASVLLTLLPGPNVLLIVGRTLAEGARAGFAVLAGVELGNAALVVLAMLGIGVVVAASATAFTVMKLIGAFYLLWLGVQQWRAPVEDGAVALRMRGAWRDVGRGFLVSATNPKVIAFFAAFFPQFLDPGRPAVPQVALMGLTWLVLEAASGTIYACGASALRPALGSVAWRRRLNRAGGVALIGAGLMTAALRRGSA